LRRLLTLLLAATAGAGPVSFGSLKILAGVREAGMGGVGVASANGPQAVVWNPCATAGISGFAATASYAKWLLDTHHQSLFVARDLRLVALGLGITSFTAGEFEYRIGPTEDPIGTFTPSELSFYLNLARPIGDMVQLGLTGRYFCSHIMDENASGMGIDVGVRVRPLERFVVGASIVDFGKTVSYIREVVWLPARGRFGIGYDLLPFDNGRLTMSADGEFFIYTKEPDVRIGAEAAWRELALRFGYSLLSTNHLALGMGIRLKDILGIDYSFAPFGSDLGTVHRLSVGIGR